MPQPNGVLAAALALTGWSNGEAARQINARAKELQHRQIAVHVSTVGRWISRGGQPREPVPQILADVISSALGTELTPEDLQLRGRRAPAAGPTVLTVLLTADEVDTVGAAARRTGQSLAQYIRTAATRSAQADVILAPRPASA